MLESIPYSTVQYSTVALFSRLETRSARTSTKDSRMCRHQLAFVWSSSAVFIPGARWCALSASERAIWQFQFFDRTAFRKRREATTTTMSIKGKVVDPSATTSTPLVVLSSSTRNKKESHRSTNRHDNNAEVLPITHQASATKGEGEGSEGAATTLRHASRVGAFFPFQVS